MNGFLYVQNVKIPRETEAVPKEEPEVKEMSTAVVTLLCRSQSWWELGMKHRALRKP